MSRVYWHTRERTAELRGSERGWLRHVALGLAEAAWDLDAPVGLERAELICAMIPEVPEDGFGANYLHRHLREAQAAGGGAYEVRQRLMSSLKLRLTSAVADARFRVAGVELDAFNVALNTALVAGSDAVRLAAKIYGWCEGHCWIEGPDRAWAASIIETALDAGLYRRGLRYAGTGRYRPKDRWSDQGWGDVLELLRDRDGGPVVLSYSVTDSFPNQEIAGWQPAIDPSWRPDWANDEQGRAEWEGFGAEDQAEYQREQARDQWYDLPDGERWDLAMAGLRRGRPWARLAPDTLAEVMFSHPVTVYDLIAPDRDERVRAACLEPEPVRALSEEDGAHASQ